MNDMTFLHKSFDDAELGSPSEDEKTLIAPDIYLVEDDELLGKSIKLYLERSLGLTVYWFVSPHACQEALTERLALTSSEIPLDPFCLITDISFEDGGADGLLLIDILKERGFKFVSLVMTGFASIETAIQATKKGVFHYLTKPFDLEVLGDLVKKALTKQLGVSETLWSKEQMSISLDSDAKPRSSLYTRTFKIEAPTEDDFFCGIIGRSKVMRDVFDRIRKVAASDSTVLINGPSGTGKELVATAIHKLSGRATNTMVSVNCGAIPSELLESELFGHEKGSFTGAISSRKGRFEVANNGTIFLDEIGDMPLLLQVKLLRVLQSRMIERVGSTEPHPINVRIITATHRNLEAAVMDGDFREDLYYRLNVIPIKVPALAQRRDDIPLLISYFLSRYSSADGRNTIEFDDESLELLMTYNWPGNVRELENLMERLVILKGGSVIRASDLPAKFLEHFPSRAQNYESLIKLPEDGVDFKKIISDIEDSLIMQALEKTGGNKNQASKLLCLNRTTLIEKMKKKGLAQQ